MILESHRKDSIERIVLNGNNSWNENCEGEFYSINRISCTPAMGKSTTAVTPANDDDCFDTNNIDDVLMAIYDFEISLTLLDNILSPAPAE